VDGPDRARHPRRRSFRPNRRARGGSRSPLCRSRWLIEHRAFALSHSSNEGRNYARNDPPKSDDHCPLRPPPATGGQPISYARQDRKPF
jgi:hypothetical protein